MREYPAAAQSFTVNGKQYNMMRMTLRMQSFIEDESRTVSYREILHECTTMTDDDIDTLRIDQMMAIYHDIIAFSYDTEDGDGEPKKP